MDLHLDDRLLHGRILHGWGRRLGARRYVLVIPAAGDPARRAVYAAVAREAGAELVLAAADAAPAPRAGDFWLADGPAAALALWRAGRRYRRLILIGLRRSAGRRLGPDITADEADLDALRALQAAGVGCERRRFPDEAGEPLPPL
ncbi:MAG: PTS sugar transporter subunit IIB [Candidatus Krumholzibacteriota bacterium]|nr:PTS sugar transporter subunit IIB [Candidatus Krumholzibacteriota bacterium]